MVKVVETIDYPFEQESGSHKIKSSYTHTPPPQLPFLQWQKSLRSLTVPIVSWSLSDFETPHETWGRREYVGSIILREIVP